MIVLQSYLPTQKETEACFINNVEKWQYLLEEKLRCKTAISPTEPNIAKITHDINSLFSFESNDDVVPKKAWTFCWKLLPCLQHVKQLGVEIQQSRHNPSIAWAKSVIKRLENALLQLVGSGIFKYSDVAISSPPDARLLEEFADGLVDRMNNVVIARSPMLMSNTTQPKPFVRLSQCELSNITNIKDVPDFLIYDIGRYEQNLSYLFLHRVGKLLNAAFEEESNLKSIIISGRTSLQRQAISTATAAMRDLWEFLLSAARFL